MPNQQTYQLLAYLMTALQANGFRVGTGQQLRLQHLLEQLPEDIALDSLKTRLAPIFVKSKEEQELFYELFEEAKRSLEVKDLALATPLEKPKNPYKKWIWIAAALVTIAIAIALWFRLNPPDITYEYLKKPMPIISQTIIKGDTASIALADAFRANELLRITEKEERIVYTLCNGLSEHTDLSVGFSRIDSLGNLTYIAQDTGKVESCVTMAFEVENDAQTVVDTILVEIDVVSRIVTPIDEPIVNTQPKVENILSLRPYPIKRNIEELTAPKPEGWAKAYLNFEIWWWGWTEILMAFMGIFYFLIVGLLVGLYFKKFKHLIRFKKATLTIPYKVGLLFHKRKLADKINKETETVFNQLMLELNPDSEIYKNLVAKKEELEIRIPSQERRTKSSKAGNRMQQQQQSFMETPETNERNYNVYDDPFEEVQVNVFENIDFKNTLSQLLEIAKAEDFKKEVLTATYTINFNKILNIVLPILIIVLGVFIVLKLLVQFHLKFVFSVLIGVLIWAIARFRADDRKIVAELDSSQKAPFVWNIQVPDNHKIIYNEHFYSALNQLRQRTEDQFYKLNVPETVNATIQSGGQIHFQYTQQTKPPEYLMLIDRRSAANHRAAMFNMLFESFRANDVIVERYYFDGDIRLVFNEIHPNGIRLKDLKYQYQNARLLILSDGYSLLNAQNGKLSKWTEVLSAWKDKAIMTPNAPNNWGRKERQLAENFVVLPSSIRGFQSVIEEFEATEPADFSKWQQIEAKSLEKIEFKGDLMETLTHYYAKGEDLRLIKWIAACAIYPTIHWDLTLSYGKLLADKTNDLGFVSLDNLLEINRLPWFVEGKIPNQVREELLTFLEKNDAEFLKAARQHLHELMQNNPPPKDSAAFEDYQMNVVINEMMMENDKERQKELEEKFRKMVEAGVEPDFTVLKYLDRPQSPLDFYVPDAWKKYVFNDGKPFLGRKNWTWAIPIWAILSVFIMAYYPSLPQCSGQEVEYDNRQLCLNGFKDEMLLREIVTLDLIQKERFAEADSIIKEVSNLFVQTAKNSNGKFLLINKEGVEYSSDDISFFKNVSTAYYNKGVPFYNIAKANKYVWIEGSADKNTACSFFKAAYDLDSTVQIYQNLTKDCNGEIFNGYILPLLKGKVLDSKTKKPLSDVQLMLENRTVINTDKRGEYYLKLGKEPILSLSILFEKKQYVSNLKHFELKNGLEVLETIYLELDKKTTTIPSLPHPEKERPKKPINEQQNNNSGNSEPQLPTNQNNNPLPTQQSTVEQTTPQPTATLHIPTMVKVNGGSFNMGNIKDYKVFEVNLSNYQIGKYEVTNKEFLDFLQQGGIMTSKAQDWLDVGKGGTTRIYEQNNQWAIQNGFENHPVVGVTWDGATEYCKWISEKTGKNYRLPTEAEWEFAAKNRSNSDYKYSGSNTLSTVGWYNGNSKNTYAVGTRQANDLGVYDMSGNVWEWCSDWYERDYLINLGKNQKGESPFRKNPTGPIESVLKLKVKVQRGGAFDENEDKCTVDFRNYAPTNQKRDNYGFRVVLEE